jgi:hypothetical protein
MMLRRLFVFGTSVFAFLLSISITPGEYPQVFAASVSSKMESPEFWIEKTGSPDRLLLTFAQIHTMNEANLSTQDLLLCRVKDLKEEWTREEILALLKEDWEGFGETSRVRYGRNGKRLEGTFWKRLRENLNRETLKEKNRILLALIVKRADVRVFPTDEPCMNSPASYEFDRFQHSSVSPGSLIAIYHFSKDKEWAYVQTGFIRGWVRTTDLAIAKEREEAERYEEKADRLVITGSFVEVFSDPSLRQALFLAQMGASFPMAQLPSNSGGNGRHYAIRIPFREADGQLTFRNGYIRGDEDVHHGFLPFDQRHIALQGFKMLHQPYGWGEMFGARDCSRFIMDLFGSFGLMMPRNSKEQARIGIPLGPIEGKTSMGRKSSLDRAAPLATLLHFPGHIMLYLGKDEGKYYAIHNIWGIQKSGHNAGQRSEKSGPAVERIGKVVVSDLNTGRSGPNKSLLDRITDIRFIGGVR